jgi:hypothetical protein
MDDRHCKHIPKGIILLHNGMYEGDGCVKSNSNILRDTKRTLYRKRVKHLLEKFKER